MVPLRRIKLMDLNQHVICVLCSGYYVEATTIIECLHTFCKTCIVRYLQTSSFCPVCEVQVHKTKPLLSLREDKTLQDVVYKLVPGLFHNEMARRTEFYSEHPEAGGDKTEQSLKERRHFFHVDDEISLSLEFLPPAHAHAHALGLRPLRGPTASAKGAGSPRKDPGEESSGGASRREADDAKDDGEELNEDEKFQLPHRRYLMCPASVQIRHLEKFIRLKYGLTSSHRVDIVHAGDCLSPELTLLDVVYMYKYTEDGPLNLQYTVIAPPVTLRKRPRPRKGLSPSKIESKLPQHHSSKKIKIETTNEPNQPPPEHPAVTEEISNCRSVVAATEEESDSNKDDAKQTLSTSLDSSRDDGDDAMVIDESVPDNQVSTNESDETKDLPIEKSTTAVSSSSQSSEKENHSLIVTCIANTSNAQQTSSSIESLKALVNNSPHYPSYNNSESPKVSRDCSSKNDPQIEKSNRIERKLEKEKCFTKQNIGQRINGVSDGKSISKEKEENKHLVSVHSSVALPTGSTTTQADALKISTATNVSPTIAFANSIASTIAFTSVSTPATVMIPAPPSVSLNTEALPQKPLPCTKSLPPSYIPTSSTQTLKSMPALPINSIAQVSRSQSNISKMNVMPPAQKPFDPTKPRLGRPPNKLRLQYQATAANTYPRIISSDVRKMPPIRGPNGRTVFYPSNRKNDKNELQPPSGPQTIVDPPKMKTVPPPIIPQSLVNMCSPLITAPNESVTSPILKSLVSAPVGLTSTSTPKDSLLSSLSTTAFNPMNGMISPEMQRLIAAAVSAKDKMNGFSPSPSMPSSFSETVHVNTSEAVTPLTNQSASSPRSSAASVKASSGKSPGRTKSSNSPSILSIAQSLANKQQQLQQISQNCTGNAIGTTASSSVMTTAPSISATTPLAGIPTTGVDNNPLLPQLQTGLNLFQQYNPALAAAYIGNYQAYLSAQMRNLQESQKKPDTTPMDLSPTSKASGSPVCQSKPKTPSAPISSKYIPITPKVPNSNAANSSSTKNFTNRVSLKIPNVSTNGNKSPMNSRTVSNATIKTTNSVAAPNALTSSVKSTHALSTVSRCTPVSSLVNSRNTSSPLSASAASPQSARSPVNALPSVPSPKLAQSPPPSPSVSTSSTSTATTTISPPTPEVTITKLPSTTSSQVIPNSTSSPSTTVTTAVNTAPASSKIPPHTNTVSITKRPSNSNSLSNKFAVSRSPSSNASVRQIANPSLLPHQLEARNHTVSNKNTANAKSPSSVKGPTAPAVNGHSQAKSPASNPLNNNNNKVVRVDS